MVKEDTDVAISVHATVTAQESWANGIRSTSDIGESNQVINMIGGMKGLLVDNNSITLE